MININSVVKACMARFVGGYLSFLRSLIAMVNVHAPWIKIHVIIIPFIFTYNPSAILYILRCQIECLIWLERKTIQEGMIVNFTLCYAQYDKETIHC